jgi:hypothetical protein
MQHLDQARRAAIGALRQIVAHDPRIEKVVLIDDLFGNLRVAVWTQPDHWEAARTTIDQSLKDAQTIGRYWSGEIWNAALGTSADRLLYEAAWSTAEQVEESPILRIADRHRNRGAWFRNLSETAWPSIRGVTEGGPPIIVFYSFKGGLGRSTAVASFAIQQARRGQRVVVLDFDLDAPGVGSLLAADRDGTVASWGVVDYLLERPHGDVELADYYHACRREAVTGSGEILAFPTGRLDAEYLSKLARVDLEPPSDDFNKHPIFMLLQQIRDELQPHWLLLDARTGLSEPAGMLLAGFAHLHVLFGGMSEQSWVGLRLVIQRLGSARVDAGHAQAECALVQSMVPRETSVAATAIAAFTERARDEFVQNYYAEDPTDPTDERFWYVRDAEGEDAPHVSIPLSYDTRLAHFRLIDDVANELATAPEYIDLGRRISERFVPEPRE